jgi:hypothetical protein
VAVGILPLPAGADEVPRVGVEVGEMVEVGLGVSVGWANAVWVKPTAKVLTTEVSISPMLIVGVSSGAGAP